MIFFQKKLKIEWPFWTRQAYLYKHRLKKTKHQLTPKINSWCGFYHRRSLILRREMYPQKPTSYAGHFLYLLFSLFLTQKIVKTAILSLQNIICLLDLIWA